MVRAHVLVASFFALLSYALAKASVSDATKGSLVRRHSQETEEDHTFADMRLSEKIHDDHQMERQHKSGHRTHLTNNICNYDWPLTTTSNRNGCENGGVRIQDSNLCRLAAQQMGFTYNGTWDWSWTVLTSNPQSTVIPEGCLILNGIVHYNNEASTYTDQAAVNGVKLYKGVQICMRHKYQNGIDSVESRSGNACSGTTFCGRTASGEAGACSTKGGTSATSDYEAIDGTTAADASGNGGDYNECHAATSCIVGNDWCSLKAFEDNGTISTNNKPNGCFRDTGFQAGTTISVEGCFSYNAIDQSLTSVQGRAVCRLKASYTSQQTSNKAAQTNCIDQCGQGSCDACGGAR